MPVIYNLLQNVGTSLPVFWGCCIFLWSHWTNLFLYSTQKNVVFNTNFDWWEVRASHIETRTKIRPEWHRLLWTYKTFLDMNWAGMSRLCNGLKIETEMPPRLYIALSLICILSWESFGLMVIVRRPELSCKHSNFIQFSVSDNDSTIKPRLKLDRKENKVLYHMKFVCVCVQGGKMSMALTWPASET